MNTAYGMINESGAVLTDPEKSVDMSLMWQVWRLLQSHYVRPQELNTQKMVDGAVHGLVSGIGDPYTLYMSSKESTQFHNTLDGHLDGIGAELSLKTGQIEVIRAIKKSPAEKAGILAHDNIITVDGKKLDGMTLEQIVALIRGKKGTSVTLTLMRGKETTPRSFTITRDTISVPSVEYEVQKSAKGDLGVLTVNEFGTDTIQEVNDMLKNLKDGDLKGLIIDLRFNGGGYLDGAVDLSSMFIGDGKVVTVAGRDHENTEHDVTGHPILPTMPIAVLINEGSASASEIFAGAMKDHNRAKLIGMKSFGKGTVQEVLDLPNGASLRVTIARWLTPNGTDIGKVGIMPDIVLDRTADDYINNKDPQLDAAKTWLLEGKDVTGGKKPATGSGASSK